MENKNDFAKAVLSVFEKAPASICNDWMNEEWSEVKWYRESEYFGDEEHAEFLDAFEALGDVTIEVAEHHGGEGLGEDYYCVYEFSKGDDKAYLKFDGWYASHYGSEFQAVFLVEPRQKVITVYE